MCTSTSVWSVSVYIMLRLLWCESHYFMYGIHNPLQNQRSHLWTYTCDMHALWVRSGCLPAMHYMSKCIVNVQTSGDYSSLLFRFREEAILYSVPGVTATTELFFVFYGLKLTFAIILYLWMSSMAQLRVYVCIVQHWHFSVAIQCSLQSNNSFFFTAMKTVLV